MTDAIAYFIAGTSTFALLTLLLFNAYVALSRKREDVRNAEDQVRLFLDCFKKIKNTPNEASAEKMLETSIQIYTQIEKRYNETLRKPIYRFPGLLMGFRKAEGDWEIKEEDQLWFITEQQNTDYHMKEEETQ